MSNFRFPYQSDNPISTTSRPSFLSDLNDTNKWSVIKTGTNWDGSSQQFTMPATSGPKQKIEFMVALGPDDSGVFSNFYSFSVMTNELQRAWSSFNWCYWKNNNIKGGHFYLYLTYNGGANLPIGYCVTTTAGGNVDYYKIYYRYVD